MKRIIFYLWAMGIAMIPVLQSCNDDDDDQLCVREMATVYVKSGDTYYLDTDDGIRLIPDESRIPWYKPVDGQRVIADYTPLEYRSEVENPDLSVRVNSLFDVLTKQVEELTEENEDEYGDDPVHIEGMWLGANFLNIRFRINRPYQTAHRVSLVQNTTTGQPLIDDEGYICLEYRYNNYDDVSSDVRRGYVSYNLGSYGPMSETLEGVLGLKVRINSAVNGIKDIVFDYANREIESKQVDVQDGESYVN